MNRSEIKSALVYGKNWQGEDTITLVIEKQSYSGILHDGIGIIATLEYPPNGQTWKINGNQVDFWWSIEDWGLCDLGYLVRSKAWAVRRVIDMAMEYYKQLAAEH